jgi:hypothetical protein
MTLRFASAVLLMLAALTLLLYATQTQRDFDNALSARLEPLPVPHHHGSLFQFTPRG